MQRKKAPKIVETRHVPAGSGWTCKGSRGNFYALRIKPEILDLLIKFAKYNPGKDFHFNVLMNLEQKFRHELPHWNVFFDYEEVR